MARIRGFGSSSIAKLPSEFEHYFNDRFPYRTEMIGLAALVRYRVLSTCRSPNVLIGKSGWLFYKEGKAEEFLHNDHLFNKDELAWWAIKLEKRRVWCESRGIKYIFYVPPTTKHHIFRNVTGSF